MCIRDSFISRVALYKGPKFNYLIFWDREKWALHQGSHFITGVLYRRSTLFINFWSLHEDVVWYHWPMRRRQSVTGFPLFESKEYLMRGIHPTDSLQSMFAANNFWPLPYSLARQYSNKEKRGKIRECTACEQMQ